MRLDIATKRFGSEVPDDESELNSSEWELNPDKAK
tara:strand:- start:741 stop:845 length:105 start_codon:yes stop_codon:yes gene_type:complete